MKGGERQETRRQHYVPQGMQRRWASKPGWVCRMALSNGKVKEVAIKSNWQEPWFYDEGRGDREEGVEDVLGELDDTWCKVARVIEEAGDRVAAQGSEDRELLDYLITLQFRRTEDQSEPVRVMHEALLRRFVEQMEAAGAFEGLEGGSIPVADLVIDVDKRYARQRSLALAEASAKELRDLSMVVLESSRGRVLLPSTGVWMQNPYAEAGWPNGMGSLGAVAVAPVSPKRAVMLADLKFCRWTGRTGPVQKMTEEEEGMLAQATIANAGKEVVFRKDVKEWLWAQWTKRGVRVWRGEENGRNLPGLQTQQGLHEVLRRGEEQIRLYGMPPRRMTESMGRGRPEATE